MLRLENKRNLNNGDVYLVLCNEETQETRLVPANIELYENLMAVQSSRSSKITSWRAADDAIVNLHFINGAIQAEVIKGDRRHIIPPYFIDGIPKEILEKPESLFFYLADSYVKLTPTQEGEYLLRIHSRLRGGLHWLVWLGVGVLCIAGGMGFIIGAVKTTGVAAAIGGGVGTAAVAGGVVCVFQAGRESKEANANQRRQDIGDQQVHLQVANNSAAAEMVSHRNNQIGAQAAIISQSTEEVSVKDDRIKVLEEERDEKLRKKARAATHSVLSNIPGPQPQDSSAANKSAAADASNPELKHSNPTSEQPDKDNGLRHRNVGTSHTIFSPDGRNNSAVNIERQAEKANDQKEKAPNADATKHKPSSPRRRSPSE